jgi:hypothetical protein
MGRYMFSACIGVTGQSQGESGVKPYRSTQSAQALVLS